MFHEIFTIGLLLLLAVMSPGADFAIVTKNTLSHSRKAGIFTALGISCGNIVHQTYCILGLALIIAKSTFLFNLIKYLGAIYLLYLGITILGSKQSAHLVPQKNNSAKSELSNGKAFRQGFLCNLLNPKASLFFLALFTLVIKPETSPFWIGIFVVEMFIIISGWFITLSLILSHPYVAQKLEKAEKYIVKSLGAYLIAFAAILVFLK